MFDAKSILENIVRGAAPSQPASAGGGGSLSDIINEIGKSRASRRVKRLRARSRPAEHREAALATSSATSPVNSVNRLPPAQHPVKDSRFPVPALHRQTPIPISAISWLSSRTSSIKRAAR